MPRRQFRHSTQALLFCRVPATPRQVVVEDNSKGGCQVCFLDWRPQMGSTVILEFSATQQVCGQILWTKDMDAGIVFSRTMEAAELSVISSQLGIAAAA